MHFVHTFSIMRASGVRLINRYRRGSKLQKICIHQKHFWKWLVGGCIPIILPLYLPLAKSYRNHHQKSQTHFSHLAPFILFFLLNSRVKRGAWHNAPPKYASDRNHWFGSWNFTFMLKNRLHEINRFNLFFCCSVCFYRNLFRFLFIYFFEWLFIVNM